MVCLRVTLCISVIIKLMNRISKSSLETYVVCPDEIAMPANFVYKVCVISVVSVGILSAPWSFPYRLLTN
jgi:hypothetical protein